MKPIKSKICGSFFTHTSRSNEDCGRTIHRTNLKRVSKESLLAASILKFIENPTIFDRFIVKKLSLRIFWTPCIIQNTMVVEGGEEGWLLEKKIRMKVHGIK